MREESLVQEALGWSEETSLAWLNCSLFVTSLLGRPALAWLPYVTILLGRAVSQWSRSSIPGIRGVYSCDR